MKSLFDKDIYEEIVARFSSLTAQHQPQWGTMNVAQMVDHCIKPLQQSIGSIECEQKSNFVWRIFKSSLYNDKLWKTNLPTAPEYKITAVKSLVDSRIKLLKEIEEYHALGEAHGWKPHIRFGKFTGDQMGKMGYKHLDHHLRQFNV
ncbi:MAG: hypothetical protein ACI9J3_002413 [Parvicellaceae bacterium]|jgi:hypothetical protein